MPISEELKKVYATAPTDVHYVETLTMHHSAFPGGVRYITNNPPGWKGELETGGIATFDFVPFAAIPPSLEDQANLSLQVAIDNASLELMQNLEALADFPSEPIIVYYRVYLSSDQNTVQNDPPLKLDIISVTSNDQVISFNAGMANLRRKPFPSQLYTTDLFPGLAR